MRRGFTLIELAAVVAVVASSAMVLGPSMRRARVQQMGAGASQNLATIGQLSGSYALSNDDSIFSFTWRAGETYINLSNGREFVPVSDQEAASYQVRDILYRATGRTSGIGRILAPTSRLMHRRYSHLVLADAMGVDVSDPMWADPLDANQLDWQQNPLGHLDDDSTVPYADGIPGPGYDDNFSWSERSILQLWPFASSFQVVPAAWVDPLAGSTYVPTRHTPHLFATLGSTGNIELGRETYSDVVFPGAKVHMFTEFDRTQVGSPYFAYDHAAVPKLMFDGSVNSAVSGLARSAHSPAESPKRRWTQEYVPIHRFPIPLSGLGEDAEWDQRFRWTFLGLRGVDYHQTLRPSFGR